MFGTADLKVGNKVRILRPEYTKDGYEWGTITKINGAYINIQPEGEDWILEAYPNEIAPMGFGDGSYGEK